MLALRWGVAIAAALGIEPKRHRVRPLNVSDGVLVRNVSRVGSIDYTQGLGAAHPDSVRPPAREILSRRRVARWTQAMDEKVALLLAYRYDVVPAGHILLVPLWAFGHDQYSAANA